MPSAAPSPLDRRPVEIGATVPEALPSPHSLTANELIAMARAARARRLDP